MISDATFTLKHDMIFCYYFHTNYDYDHKSNSNHLPYEMNSLSATSVIVIIHCLSSILIFQQTYWNFLSKRQGILQGISTLLFLSSVIKYIKSLKDTLLSSITQNQCISLRLTLLLLHPNCVNILKSHSRYRQ